MTKKIQISPLKNDFQRIIDFDRINPSDKIIVFVSKWDTDKQNENYKVIEDSLSNLGQYCQLTRIEFNMQVIDFSTETNFLNVVLSFAKSFLLDYELGYSYMLNLGDTSLMLNIALLQAAQLIKALHSVDITAYMEDECARQIRTYEYLLTNSFDALVSPPVTLRLLQCIDQNMNFTSIEEHYKENRINTSLGTISNHINQLEQLGIVLGKRVSNRKLTDLGKLIKDILELKQELSH
jgi:hypothetical protein